MCVSTICTGEYTTIHVCIFVSLTYVFLHVCGKLYAVLYMIKNYIYYN